MSVSKSGMGSGAVTSSPAGIDCGSTCSASYTFDQSVTLTATPAVGSTFTGWSGTCSGTGICTVSMTAARAVSASFVLNNDIDSDGIDDDWELRYFNKLTTVGIGTDYDHDGYSDRVEYLNDLNGELDPEGASYDPTSPNAPGGTGYKDRIWLPAVLKVLL